MTDEERRQQFLADIKSKGRSSPAGKHWDEFFEFLRRHSSGAGRPPVPLILAASGASNRTKHKRLSDQLRWAIDQGCLAEALAFLQGLSDDKWNTGSAEEWDRDSYWQPDEV
jgi:hypothetical protein